jgi:hypothetical protein
VEDMKKVPSFEEAQAELGEGAMSFFTDMIRQDSSDEETPSPQEKIEKSKE